MSGKEDDPIGATSLTVEYYLRYGKVIADGWIFVNSRVFLCSCYLISITFASGRQSSTRLCTHPKRILQRDHVLVSHPCHLTRLPHLLSSQTSLSDRQSLAHCTHLAQYHALRCVHSGEHFFSESFRCSIQADLGVAH